MKSKQVKEVVDSDSNSDSDSSLFKSDGSDYKESKVDEESEMGPYSDKSYGAIDTKLCIDNLDEVSSKSKAKPTTKAKGKCKVKGKLDPIVYVDNLKSEGAKIKEAGIVIASLKKKNKAVNLNCPVETLGRVMAKLGEKKKEIELEMGFEGLFHLAGEAGDGEKGFPRLLSYWLCTRVDVSKRVLLNVDGKPIPLHPIQVRWVLGIPYGGRDVLSKVVDKKFEDRLFKDYSTKEKCGTIGMTRKTLITVLESGCSDESEFRKVFLMFVLNVLCSSTCHRMPKIFLRTTAVAD